jgi:hypothetical protein
VSNDGRTPSASAAFVFLPVDHGMG